MATDRFTNLASVPSALPPPVASTTFDRLQTIQFTPQSRASNGMLSQLFRLIYEEGSWDHEVQKAAGITRCRRQLGNRCSNGKRNIGGPTRHRKRKVGLQSGAVYFLAKLGRFGWRYKR
jgi:hypothetical protein